MMKQQVWTATLKIILTAFVAFIIAVVLAVNDAEAKRGKAVKASPKVTVKAKPVAKSDKPAVASADKSASSTPETGEEAAVPDENIAVAEDATAESSSALDAQMAAAVLDENGFPAKADFIVNRDAQAVELSVASHATPPLPANNIPVAVATDVKAPMSFAGITERGAPLLPATAGTVLLIVLMTALWRKLRGSSLLGSGGKLKVAAQQMIGPRSKVIIVEAEGRRYLVGATEQNISLLADIDFLSPSADSNGAEGLPVQYPVAEAVVHPAAIPEKSASHPFIAGESLVADKVRQRLRGMRKMGRLA